MAAQAVQHSATASGFNYEAELSNARGLLNTYWSKSQPVALPVPFSSSSSSNGGGTANCSTGSSGTGSTVGYQNPLRSVNNLFGQRVDQGVDFDGTGPVYALGDGTVQNTKNLGWPQGNYISYVLTSGAAKGWHVYVAEDCTPVVSVGENVTSSTVLCNMFEGPDGIETGWGANNNGESEASLLGQANLGNSQQDAGKYTTGMGLNFYHLLTSLGLKLSGGTNQINPPVQDQNMPANLPTWQ